MVRLVSAIAAVLLSRVVALRLSGSLPNSSHFALYVGKFCFDYGNEEVEGRWKAKNMGALTVEVFGYVEAKQTDGSKTPTNGNLWFMLFSDQKHHWLRAREFWDDLSCKERQELASWSHPVSMDPKELFWNTSVTIHQGIRPRFWYFAMVNCGAKVLEELSYSVHAVNIEGGFQEEFGMDAEGSLPLELIFCILFLMVAVGSWLVTLTRAARLSSTESDNKGSRPLLKLLQFSAGASAAGCGFRAWHHGIFAQDGEGVEEFQVLGTLCACAAKAAFTLLQFLLARGWAVQEQTDIHLRSAVFAILLCVVGLAVGCEIYEQYFHDQSTSFFLYENWTGYSILAMNLALLACAWWYTWMALHLETSPAVRRFYHLVSSAAGVYFSSLPAVALLAGLFSPWVRRKYVERVELSTRFLATVLLLLVLRPSHMDTLVAARLKNRQQPSLLPTAGVAGEEEMELQETPLSVSGAASAPCAHGGASGGTSAENPACPYALEQSS